MKLHFNVKGAERKGLAGVIGKAAGQKAVYLGVPTFAYQIGDFTVEKDGTLIFPDSMDSGGSSGVIDACAAAGFEPEEWKKNNEDSIALTVEMPRSIFTDAQLENLKKLVSSKEGLLKQALKTEDVPITVTDDRICFPWFKEGIPAEECMAYTHLIEAICRMARESKRVTAKKKDADNPKYAFRCFLLRLGFIGDEYKADRKILLRNLRGSSAFRSGNRA